MYVPKSKHSLLIQNTKTIEHALEIQKIKEDAKNNFKKN